MTGPDLMAADVAIVGAGPAGIAAAVTAVANGARVLVLDEGSHAGGQIWRHRSDGPAGEPRNRVVRTWFGRLERVATDGAARVLGNTRVVDIETDGHGVHIIAERDGEPVHVSACNLILATGARELFVPFPGWCLPGVIGVGGAQALHKAGVAFSGKRIVIAGSGPLLLPVAATLARGGGHVLCVAEQASRASVVRFAAGLWRLPSLLLQAASYRAAFRGTAYRMGTWVLRVERDAELLSVTLTDGNAKWIERADVLCTGYGLVPSTELARLVGAATRAGPVVVDSRQETSVPHVFAAGELTGIGGAPLSIVEGEIAGAAAAGCGTVDAARLKLRVSLRRYAAAMDKAFTLRDEIRSLSTPETIVCRCEDVTFNRLCALKSSRQAKLYTRTGMGACQARVCGPAVQFLFGWERDSVRSPVEPACVSTVGCDSPNFADAPVAAIRGTQLT